MFSKGICLKVVNSLDCMVNLRVEFMEIVFDGVGYVVRNGENAPLLKMFPEVFSLNLISGDSQIVW